MSSKHKHDKDKDKDKKEKKDKDKEKKSKHGDKDSKHKKDKDKDKDKGRDKVIEDNTPAGQRHNFWAHEQIEPTDDPFEDDFGENITKPLRN